MNASKPSVLMATVLGTRMSISFVLPLMQSPERSRSRIEANASPLALPPSDPRPILIKSASGSRLPGGISVMMPFWRPLRRSKDALHQVGFKSRRYSGKSLTFNGFSFEASMTSERAMNQLEK